MLHEPRYFETLLSMSVYQLIFYWVAYPSSYIECCIILPSSCCVCFPLFLSLPVFHFPYSPNHIVLESRFGEYILLILEAFWKNELPVVPSMSLKWGCLGDRRVLQASYLCMKATDYRCVLYLVFKVWGLVAPGVWITGPMCGTLTWLVLAFGDTGGQVTQWHLWNWMCTMVDREKSIVFRLVMEQHEA